MRRWTKVFELLGVNSIPVVGVLAGQWSPATALTVYWIENLIASIFTAARLFLFARWSDPSTHPAAAPDSGFALRRPGPFLLMTIPFGLAHGVMLLMVFAVVLHTWPDATALPQAALAMLVVQGLAFGADLWTLADWPVRRVNDRADYLQGRVVLVHLSILVGMLVVAWSDRPGAFFGFFVGAKTLSDFAQLLPQADIGTPDAPPRWLSAIMRRFPARNGETFDEYWRRTSLPAGQAPAKPPRPRWRSKRRKR